MMPIGNVQIFLLDFICNIFRFLMHASSTLPLLALCALLVCRRNLKRSWFAWGAFLVFIASLFSFLSVFGAFADPLLLYAKFYVQGLTPRIPDFCENGILPYTLCALFRCLGMILLLVTWVWLKMARSVHGEKNFLFSCLCLTLASFLFFISYIVQQMPFGSYPEGLNFYQTLAILSQQALHQYIGAFAPAGICSLVVITGFKLMRHAGVDEDYAKDETFFVRWSSIWSVVGLIPSCLVILGRAFASLLQKNIFQDIPYLYWQTGIAWLSLACAILLLFPMFSRLQWLRTISILIYFLHFNLPLTKDVFL